MWDLDGDVVGGSVYWAGVAGLWHGGLGGSGSEAVTEVWRGCWVRGYLNGLSEELAWVTTMTDYLSKRSYRSKGRYGIHGYRANCWLVIGAAVGIHPDQIYLHIS